MGLAVCVCQLSEGVALVVAVSVAQLPVGVALGLALRVALALVVAVKETGALSPATGQTAAGVQLRAAAGLPPGQ